ncbi:LOW QUALITY PROTEIN: reverse transcriptase [Phytophthora megakarya]|uniref:Reverse transcriptase n=1 Tax=Phytophthora megakarya TaxID=4795 RepID=A0A225V4P6_9STRA|nr:LOW QUALITY PROTEIN: reverse transcriptase [Phytophthora megakarya]
MDDALTDIAPRKEPKRRIQAPIPTVDREEKLWVVRLGYFESLTVNEAEYNVLILGLDMLESLDRRRLVVCGDSNLVIRQVRGGIDCKAPGLTLIKQKALDRLRQWINHELVHVKRDWNGSADRLASAALQRQGGIEVQGGSKYHDLVTLNRLDEILIPKTETPVVRVAAVTTRAFRITLGSHAQGPDPGDVGRSDQAGPGGGSLDRRYEKYLSGSIADLTQAEARSYGKIATDYEVDKQDLLFYCPPTPRSGDDRDRLLRLVVPETNLTSCNTITLRWKADIREWGVPTSGSGITSTEEDYIGGNVGECVNCETGKGKPVIRSESPGNLQATYPFQIIAMDPIPSLPRSRKGNTELLIWVDLFTGYLIAKASSSRSVPESYEECVLRRFGAIEMIRHDREPGFMSDFFRAFNKIMGQRQQATMAYRPKANGIAQRMVQTATRALKMYVRDLDQEYWDEYAEQLTFTINMAHDRIRGDIPHYLVHGWDPRSTLEATLPVGCTRRRDRDARRWRYRVQRHYHQSREQVNVRLREAIADWAFRHNEDVGSHQIEAGSRIWLYLDRVKEGYARKLAHLSHGPFRLDIAGTGYPIFPVVHVSKLKLVKDFPDRPRIELTVDESDRLDFDEILLPENSWVPDLGGNEYEVERISDVQSGKKTRFGRIYREFLVHWVGYNELTWVDEADLNCGAILNTFLREHANRNRFNVMQSHEEE